MDILLIKEIVILLTAVVGFAILIIKAVKNNNDNIINKKTVDLILLNVTNHLPHQIADIKNDVNEIKDDFKSLPCQVENEDNKQ